MLKSLCLWLKLCTSITGPAYVIDGDTIVVENYHVRLWGVDAEELSEPNGPRAKAYMQFIVGRNNIDCELNGQRSHGRYVGTCYVDVFGSKYKDLGQQIIEAGYALDCAHYSGGKYRPFEPAGVREKLIQKPYC